VFHVKRRWTDRLPQIFVIAVLQFVVCEYLVVGSWRGNYAYGQNLISDLGVPHCGMQGTEPCSTSWMLMNGSVVLVGLAFLAAATWLRRPAQPRAAALFLTVSGIGVIITGLVPSNTVWSAHALGASLFFLFGGCFAVTVGLATSSAGVRGMPATTPLRTAAPWIATVSGSVAIAGYFAFENGWNLGLGPGGMERVTAYAVIAGFVSIMLLERDLRRTPRNRTADLGVERSWRSSGGHQRRGVGTAVGAALALVAVTTGCSVGHAEAVVGNGTMSDDFDGPAGSAPSSVAWSYDLGGGGWGNDEVQEYTNDARNGRLDGDGNLEINAVRGADGGFTSARLTTKGKFDFTEGRAEARIKLPAGQGLHPAFWLLGSDVDEIGWPRSGEIDVIETVNDAADYSCTLHGPTADGGHWQKGGSGPWPALPADFHAYWVQRAPGSITMGIDGTTTCSLTPASVGAENAWVFDKPFFLLLNVAVGGEYPGPTDARTPDSSTMLVDYVRVTPA